MKKNYIILCTLLLSSYIIAQKTQINNQDVIPVVIIHKGDSYYLEHALWQAKQYNNRVILIGDETNNHYQQLGIEHYNMQNYYKGAQYFSTIYEHIHETPYEKQIFNFQRWFILQELMKNKEINCCMYCDSDIMMYCDVSQEIKNFEQYDISLVIPKGHSHCGSNSFWTLESLSDFCNYLTQYYKNKNNLNKWHEWFANPARKKGHGVGDMAILTEYAKSLNINKKLQLTDICNVFDDSTFDHHLSGDDGGLFEMKEVIHNKKPYKIKNIRWINNQPFCYHAGHDKLIRLKSLHCQGWKKILMESLRTPRPL